MVRTTATSPLIGWLLQGPSRTLIEFTKARLIRLRLHGLQVRAEDAAILGDERHPQYPTVARKYFYSVKDISIGGQCPCHGHASDCPVSCSSH